MTPSSPRPSLLALTAATSLALAVGVTACVRTVSGPLPRAQPDPTATATPAPDAPHDGAAIATSDPLAGSRYGGFGYSFGGAGYGTASYGGAAYGAAYGGDGYGGGGYGGASYGGGGGAAASDLYACRVASDCTIVFREQSCFPGDPVGVATARLAEARQRITIRREACGMGGPDYERRRLQNEGRWTVGCTAGRCQVVDHGIRPAPF